jgi:hypothetical protein
MGQVCYVHMYCKVHHSVLIFITPGSPWGEISFSFVSRHLQFIIGFFICFYFHSEYQIKIIQQLHLSYIKGPSHKTRSA